jgi:uncharacterized SAM-binding protein YcdF (DUF218 family)
LYFVATKVFLQPLPLLLLVIGAALANLWRRRQERRGRLLLLTVPFGVLVLSSLPAVVFPLIGTLEWRFPPLAERPGDAEALVVLSGGIHPPDGVRLRPELAPDTLYRCLHAAELYHRGPPCPVIVTGGALDPRLDIPPPAPAMRDLLVQLGVDAKDVIVEPKARTTYENAVETRKILEARGIRKVVLVTEAYHMLRSLRCFRKQGIEAVPAACHHLATTLKIRPGTFLPTPRAIEDLMAVLHEWLGLAWYSLSGKI